MENLAKVISHQEMVIKQLRAQLGQDSTNSHRPPSTDDPAARAQRQHRNRKPSKRKRGAQPGHKGTNRRLLAPELVDTLQTCLPSQCQHCQAALDGLDEQPQRHQVAEIPPVKPVITEYQLHKLTCRRCGKDTRARLPRKVSWSHFGPTASALVTTLRAEARLSLERTQKMLGSVFGLKMSLGAISAVDERTSNLLVDDHKALHQAIKSAPVAHLDETTWYLAGARRVLWAALTSRAAFFALQTNRGQEQAKELVGEDFGGVAVTDRYWAYHWIDAKRRQMCWAHLPLCQGSCHPGGPMFGWLKGLNRIGGGERISA